MIPKSDLVELSSVDFDADIWASPWAAIGQEKSVSICLIVHARECLPAVIWIHVTLIQVISVVTQVQSVQRLGDYSPDQGWGVTPGE
jgi:hypothetical protein